MSEKPKNRAKKVVGVIGAWLTLPILGIGMLVFTSVAGQAISGAQNYHDDNYSGAIVLSGILGLVILSIIILAVWKIRRKIYFFHLLIGLWIGLGLYTVILISGLTSYYVKNSPSADSTACTTTEQQFLKSQAAIVPIATDLGYGTGFVIDDQGTVVTAHHVVKGASKIEANYASGAVGLKLVDQAPEYDVAILRLDRFEKAHFNLTEVYSVGDPVYAYGYPGNTFTAGAPSVSSGIVSRSLGVADLRLTVQSAPDGLTLIQTDAAVNPGNSGGPLISRCGVIGIVVSNSDSAGLSDYVGAVSEQGIGYAVSAKTVADRFKLVIQNDY